MSAPLIAIVGRLSSDPFDKEAVRELEMLREALHELGRELAIAGFRMMVYTAAPNLEYAATHVVRGYLDSGKAKKRSILVRRPQVAPGDEFAEEATNPCYELDVRPSESWEVAFYLSLFTLDGMLAVGNGSFTYIGGLHAVGARLPVLALGGFGGVADEILRLLGRRISESDYQLMAQTKKDTAWAKSCVEALGRQVREVAHRGEEDRVKRELQRSTLAAILSGFGVLALLAIVAESLRHDGIYWLYAYVTALVPAIAGFIGAVQRVVFGFYWGEDLPFYRKSFLLSGALGFSAGGFAGSVYSLSQAISTHSTPAALGSLALWAITFGYVAGLSREKVLVVSRILCKRLSCLAAVRPPVP